MSRYASFGLDETKKATDDATISYSKVCMWCNQRHEKGFSMCFANQIICKDCVNSATNVVNQHRWTIIEDCYKCGCKDAIAYLAAPPWQQWIALCKPCIDWGKEVLNKPPVIPTPQPGSQLKLQL